MEMDLNWEDLLTYLKTVDMIKCFMDKLISAMDISIPKKKITNKKHNTSLSEVTRPCVKQKHRAWESYMENRYTEHYNKYTRARNKAKSAVTRERKNLEKGIAESAKTNCKHFWSCINSKRKTKSGIAEFHSQKEGINIVASTDHEKAEVLGDFFTSVFTKETDSDIGP